MEMAGENQDQVQEILLKMMRIPVAITYRKVGWMMAQSL
jgi:hypothetical protein